jgi:hypothetical protein
MKKSSLKEDFFFWIMLKAKTTLSDGFCS